MALKLSLAGGRGTRLLTHGTVSIGRGERNDWVLPDPDRHLSKTHCVIALDHGRAVLTDLSVNGVYINGASQPTVRDSQVVLTDGDTIRLGDYTITVEEVADPAPGGRGAAQGWANDPLGDDPLDDPAGSAAVGIDPLDDPLAAPIGGGDRGFRHPVRHSAPTARALDPFDEADRAAAPPGQRDTWLDDAPGQRADSGFPQPDNVDANRAAMLVPRVLTPTPPAAHGSVDFDDLIGDLSDLLPQSGPVAAPPAAPPVRPGPDPFAEADHPARAAPQPQPPQAAWAEPVPAPRAPPPVAPAAPPVATGQDPMRAFLEGAGLPPNAIPGLLAGDQEATMRTLGQVFRAMSDGVREVLMSRAAIKGELRVEQTLLRSSNNNPLKFSITPEDALLALLTPGRPGYMPALAATLEAFDDIKTHELAVMAGVQTALVGLLKRFDPDALEARLAPGGLASVLPAARKARLWEAFRDTYQTIATEAEDDFQAVFGRAFAKAYMAQTRKE